MQLTMMCVKNRNMSGVAARMVDDRSPWNTVWSIAIVVVVGVASPAMGGENELISKEEWSILQSVEYRYRDSSFDDHLLLIVQSGKHLAGVLSAKEGQRLWILLDPDHRPFVKQLPKGEYHISPTEFERITAFSKIHPVVQSALKQSVQATPNAK